MTYELLYIIPATKTEVEVAAVKEEISQLIKARSETCLRDESLGKRKMTHGIHGVRYGYYVLVCFTAEPSAVQALDTELRHNVNVLRHLLTKALPGAETAPVKLVEYEVPDMVRRKTTKRPEGKSFTTSARPLAAKEAMSDEQLTKKLDEILQTNPETL